MWINKQPQEQKTSGGPHRDLDRNLWFSKAFIVRTEPEWPQGIRVQITDSHGLPNSICMIVWKPPMNAKMGNYATPIFMHKPYDEFTQKVEEIYKLYRRMASDYFAKHPQEAEA